MTTKAVASEMQNTATPVATSVAILNTDVLRARFDRSHRPQTILRAPVPRETESPPDIRLTDIAFPSASVLHTVYTCPTRR